jgi:hypothetical protein
MVVDANTAHLTASGRGTISTRRWLQPTAYRAMKVDMKAMGQAAWRASPQEEQENFPELFSSAYRFTSPPWRFDLATLGLDPKRDFSRGCVQDAVRYIKTNKLRDPTNGEITPERSSLHFLMWRGLTISLISIFNLQTFRPNNLLRCRRC